MLPERQEPPPPQAPTQHRPCVSPPRRRASLEDDPHLLPPSENKPPRPGAAPATGLGVEDVWQEGHQAQRGAALALVVAHAGLLPHGGVHQLAHLGRRRLLGPPAHDTHTHTRTPGAGAHAHAARRVGTPALCLPHTRPRPRIVLRSLQGCTRRVAGGSRCSLDAAAASQRPRRRARWRARSLFRGPGDDARRLAGAVVVLGAALALAKVLRVRGVTCEGTAVEQVEQWAKVRPARQQCAAWRVAVEGGGAGSETSPAAREPRCPAPPPSGAP